jgi:hypothetical protein
MRVQHLLLVLPLCVENRREAEIMVGEVEEEADAMYELHDNVVVSGCGWSLEVKRVLLGRTKALLHCSPIKSRAPMVNVLGLFLHITKSNIAGLLAAQRLLHVLPESNPNILASVVRQYGVAKRLRCP